MSKNTRFGLTFEAWQAEVDKALAFYFGGFDSRDLPDWCWWDLWDCGLSPSEAVTDYIEDGGGPFA